jgi:transketolase
MTHDTTTETLEPTASAEDAPATSFEERVRACRDAAYRIRRGVLVEGEAQGEGYVGQALGAADLLAVVYRDALRFDAGNADWEGRDRFLLSIGHYALLLYAAFAEAGIIPQEELVTYAADDSRLPMSAMSTYSPATEISGGSLGHGLGLAVGTALGLRVQGLTDQKVFVLTSDGELNEGSTWEAAMSAGQWRTGNLLAFVDMNGIQADGPTSVVQPSDAQAQRWRSFGWHVQRVDGNDIAALLEALDTALEASSPEGPPHVIICDTRVGCGVPMLETREKLHFMRIDHDEWSRCQDQLTAGYQRED